MEKKMTNIRSRILSFVVAFVMVFCLFPPAAFADGGETSKTENNSDVTLTVGASGSPKYLDTATTMIEKNIIDDEICLDTVLKSPQLASATDIIYIKLNRDLSLDAARTTGYNGDKDKFSAIQIPKDLKVEIDLNGHSINYNFSRSNGILCLNPGGQHITIVDSSAGKSGSIHARKPIAFSRNMSEKVRIFLKGGTYSMFYGDWTISGMYKLVNGQFLPTMDGGSCELSIEDGVVINGSLKYSNYPGSLYLKGGEINGRLEIYNNASNTEVVISGGTVNYDEKEALGDAALTVHQGNVLKISGGVIKAKNNSVFDISGDKDGDKVIISGGEFRTEFKYLVNGFHSKSLEITGGSFYAGSTDVNEAFYNQSWACKTPEGKVIGYSQEHGCFELVDTPQKEESGRLSLTAGGSTNEYTSPSEAFAAAKSGGKLQLKEDCSYKNGLPFSLAGDVSLDLNGYTLSLSPLYSMKDSGSIHVESGTLTIEDSSQVKSGKLFFPDAQCGITLGKAANLVINGGTIGPSVYSTIFGGRHNAAQSATKIDINGGYIIGPEEWSAISLEYGDGSAVNMTGGVVEGKGGGAALFTEVPFTMTGGTLRADQGSALSIRSSANISGDAELFSKGIRVVIREVYYNENKPFVIGGNAYIHADSPDNYAALHILYPDDFTVQEDARIAGGSFAIALAAENPQGEMSINGGHFKYNELPFSDSSRVSYKADSAYTGIDPNKGFYILSPEANGCGAYEGYFDLVTRESLDHKDPTGTLDLTYQDLEKLNYAIAMAEAINDLNDYTPDSVEAMQNALAPAKALLANTNANQAEIDYRTEKLNEAVAALVSKNSVDISNLSNGRYSVAIMMRMAGTKDASMASGAVDGNAELVLSENNGEKLSSLKLCFHPTQVAGRMGHLTKLWLYNGNDSDSNHSNGHNHAGNKDYMTECAVLSHYSVDENNPAVAVPCGAGCTQGHTHYPYEISVPLNWMDLDASTYVCRVSVDQMTDLGVGDQNVDIYVKWGTLKPLSLEPTLKLSKNEVLLKAAAEGEAKSFDKLEISMFNAPDYNISVESSEPSVASAALDLAGKNVTVTAEGAGKAVVRVKASKSGEADIIKEISVSVAPASAQAVAVKALVKSADGNSVSVELSGDTLLTNEGSVSVAGNEIRIDAVLLEGGVPAAGVESSELSVSHGVSAALAGADRPVTVVTNVGDISLDAALMDKLAAQPGEALLSIGRATNPDPALYAAAYEVQLKSGGSDITFGAGKAVVTVPFGEDSGFAYYMADGKLKERLALSVDTVSQTASWTTGHFSLWLLSKDEYQVETSGGGTAPASQNFLEKDGNYYVDIALWKAATDEESMGNVAFKNNSRALVTVSGGKVTRVEFATNPVDVGTYHSGIIGFKSDSVSDLQVLEEGPLTTTENDTEVGNYSYVMRASFTLPSEAQPKSTNHISYVPVNFLVPDTPMGNGYMQARMKFIWSSAVPTSASELTANTNTATGVNPLTGEDIKSINLIDSASGIKLAADTNTLPEKASFSVEILSSGPDYDKAAELMSAEKTPWKLYRILALVDGNAKAPDGQVRISVPCGAGGLKVFRINLNGGKTVIKGSVKNGYYIFNSSSLGLFAISDLGSGPKASEKFKDVAGHWAARYIDIAYERGLFAGTSETSFSPNTPMNRGMLVTVLYRLAGKPAVSGDHGFGDVKAENYFSRAVIWAKQNGIVSGYPDGGFGPGRDITREQLATILYGYAKKYKLNVSASSKLEGFKDADRISAYASEAMKWAVGSGLISGTAPDTLAPSASATRAQVAVILTNFMDKVLK